ncbi:hypothetical protein F4779DRAFT_621640 [Xylariaceae sp. FL0662B]|nr:hypothetical protein F4779DRAFT_621640 [Xylariaceae sp. FL0662B]
MQLTRALFSLGLMLAPIVSGNPVPEGDGLTSAKNLLPRASYNCPATNNGQDRNYPAHTFTSGQVTAARLAAHNILQSKGESWQPGAQDYPHFFNNNEQFPFECGRKKAEFPIKVDGTVWQTGEAVQTIPDRVIFEYAWTNGKVQTKECGVVRHGPPPSNAFLNCPS